MKRLRDIHQGETATIIGMGPSIRSLRAKTVPPGPVITINHAILYVRKLHLPNPIYTMQKDGCTVHLFAVPPPICICPSPRMVEPRPPEILLLSAAESSHCFAKYPLRHIFDVERDFGIPWTAMSVPVAARIAHLMGCTALYMIAHDAYTRGIYARAPGGGKGSANGYRRAAVQTKEYAESVDMAISFV